MKPEPDGPGDSAEESAEHDTQGKTLRHVGGVNWNRKLVGVYNIIVKIEHKFTIDI